MSLALYLETARHLQPRQITGRLRFWLSRPSAPVVEAPRRRDALAAWRPPAERPASLTGPARLKLLNREQDVGSAEAWNDLSRPMLWLYNLHYFDDLAAQGAAGRAAWQGRLIERWIAENPAPQGVGWEPYPISLRLVNWIKWALAGNAMTPSMLQSLASQAAYLSARMETHLLGNHLLANAKALAFAGAFFEGPIAAEWLSTAWKTLQEQWSEQILPDGGHFERSPMYHSLALEDALDLANLFGHYGLRFPESSARAAAQSLLDFLPGVLHTDGEIAFFNDCAFGVAPKPAQLFDYAKRLGLSAAAEAGPSLARPDFGLWSMQGGDSRLIMDAGAIGPDYLLGHAHCDTLSYELSVGRRRLIVNSGTYEYAGPQRGYFRGTLAHNTVALDGEDQHEVWATFRVARRGYPMEVRWQPDGPVLSAAHTGYRRLPGRPLHRRSARFEPGLWRVHDRIEGQGPRRAVSSVHLHPDVKVLRAEPGRVLCDLDGRKVALESSGFDWSVEEACHAPEFGLKAACVVLRQRFSAAGDFSFGHRVLLDPAA